MNLVNDRSRKKEVNDNKKKLFFFSFIYSNKKFFTTIDKRFFCRRSFLMPYGSFKTSTCFFVPVESIP